LAIGVIARSDRGLRDSAVEPIHRLGFLGGLPCADTGADSVDRVIEGWPIRSRDPAAILPTSA
jgi:hypothetical protein